MNSSRPPSRVASMGYLRFNRNHSRSPYLAKPEDTGLWYPAVVQLDQQVSLCRYIYMSMKRDFFSSPEGRCLNGFSRRVPYSPRYTTDNTGPHRQLQRTASTVMWQTNLPGNSVREGDLRLESGCVTINTKPALGTCMHVVKMSGVSRRRQPSQPLPNSYRPLTLGEAYQIRR